MITIPALILPILVGFSLFSNHLDPDQQPKFETRPLSPVSVEEVHLQDGFTWSKSYSGVIESRRSSELGFEAAGRITEILVEEGDSVAPGQLLASIDASSIRAFLGRLSAQRKAAQARLSEALSGPRKEEIDRARALVDEVSERLSHAQREADRARFLLGRGALAQAESDQVTTNVQVLEAQLRSANRRVDELLSGTRSETLDTLRAEVEQVEAEIARAEVQLRQTRLRAPFAGRIARRMVDEGTVVSGGQPALEIVENLLQVRVPVPVEISRKVKTGDQQTLQVAGREVVGTVAAVGPRVDRSSRTVPLLVTVEATGSKLLPGEIAQIHFEFREDTEGFWLPIEALTKSTRGLWACFGIFDQGENGRFSIERHDVEVIHSNGTRAFVRGTLRDGSLVVNSGIQRLVPGQSVSINAAQLAGRLEPRVGFEIEAE
jgi:multidrug efflux pump subunit AcrA (membrane-fusion protein)